MYTRVPILLSATALLAALPFSAYAAATDFFGPIVPQGADKCVCPNSAMDWGCVLQVFQSAMNALVSLGILAVIFFIAWAGFSLMTGGSNPGTRQKAVNRMLNAVVGLMLILGSWLIVDTVMKYLYDPSTTFSGQQFGPWNTILGGDPKSFCLRPNLNPGQLTNGTPTEVIHAILNPGSINSSSVATAGSGGACDPSVIESAVPGINPNEAKTLACLAGPESGCGTNIKNYKWNNGSSAYGAYQVTLGGNSACYDNPACEQAAGTNGPLNCAAGFRNGNPIPGSPVVALCTKAAANTGCSAAAADCVYKNQGPSAWTADTNGSTKQAACIQQFSGR